MADPTTLVSTLIHELKGQLAQSARELKMRDGWDMGCPVMVIDTRKNPKRVIATTIRGVTGVITTSRVIDHPVMRVFMARHKQVGAEEAVLRALVAPGRCKQGGLPRAAALRVVAALHIVDRRRCGR